MSDEEATRVAEAMAENYPGSAWGALGVMLLWLWQYMEKIEAKLDALSSDG